MPSPTCAAVNQIFVEEAGRIGPEIFRRTNTNDAWNSLVEQGEFPEGMGAILTSLVYQRAYNPNPVVFTPMASSQTPTPADQYPDANVGFQKVSVPKLKFQYQLQRANFASDDIALEDLRFAFEVEEQVENQVKQLSEYIQSTFTDYRRSEYTRLATHKVIAAPGFPEDPTNFPVVAPTQPLNQRMLDRFYPRLKRDGAGTYAYGMESGKPIFMAIMSSEQHENLLRQNIETRKDFRYSKDAEQLLGPIGVVNTYKGWFHVIDDFAPRWDIVNGAWVQRSVYDSSGDVSALYEQADFEDVIVFVKSVMTELVPTVYDGKGKAVYKEPHSYRGEWFWLNIPDRNCNPFGNVGFFASTIMTASKPNLANHGYVLRVKRCDPGNAYGIGCYGSYGS